MNKVFMRDIEKLKKVSYEIDLKVGDVVLTGRFKNVKSIVKGFGTGKKGQPTVITTKGEFPMFKFRIQKFM